MYIFIQFEHHFISGDSSERDPDLPYGDTLNFTWKADGEILGYGPEIDLNHPSGTYLINVTVRDGSGESIHHEFEVEIVKVSVEGGPPYIAFPLIGAFIVLLAVGIYLFTRGSKKGPDPLSVPGSEFSAIPHPSDLREDLAE